jgi:N-acetylglucosaminyldiphosphoundecaprenol N-acetyl-beta-D-mannosaminyltransferase
VPFVMGVGGSFDVFAGQVARAPRWMQRAGLEWAFRLAQEPRRMWRRYLIGNTRFVGIIVRELCAGGGRS